MNIQSRCAKFAVLQCFLVWNTLPFVFAQTLPPSAFIPSDTIVDRYENGLTSVVLYYNSLWELTTWQKAVVRREASLDLVNLQFSGVYKDYSRTNQLVGEGHYDHGVKSGLASEYAEDGALKSTVEYADQGFKIWELVNERNEKEVTEGSGKFTISFYSFEDIDHALELREGTLNGEFLYGRRTGEWIYRDMDSRMTDEETYENGSFIKRTTFAGAIPSVSHERKPVFVSLPSLVAEAFLVDPGSYTYLNEYFEKNIDEYPKSLTRSVTFPGGMKRLLLLMAVKSRLQIDDNILAEITVDEQGHLKKVKDPFALSDSFDEEFDYLIKPHEFKLLPAIKNGKPCAVSMRIPVSNSPEWINYLQTASQEDVNAYVDGLNREQENEEKEEDQEAKEFAMSEKKEKALESYHSLRGHPKNEKPVKVTLYYNHLWELTKPEKSIVRREAYLDFATLKFSGPYNDYTKENKLVGDGYYCGGVIRGLNTEYFENGTVKSIIEQAKDGFIIWELTNEKGVNEVTRGTGKFTIPFYQAEEGKRTTRLGEGILNGEFLLGKRVGTWIYTKTDGKKLDEETYEKGALIRRLSLTEFGPKEVMYKKPVLISISSLATEAFNFDRKLYTNLNQFFEENIPGYPGSSKRLITLHGGMKELLLLIAVNMRIPIDEITIAKLKVDEHGNLKKINLKPFLFDYDGRWNRTDLMNELERIIQPNERKLLPAVMHGKSCEMTMRIPVSNDPHWIEFLKTAPDEQVDDYLASLNQN